MRRTKIDLCYVDALVPEDPAHPFGQFQKILFGVVTPTDPRLISHHKDQITELFGSPAKLKDAFNELKIFRLAYISVIDIDHAIAIQKQGGVPAQRHTPASSV